ATVMTEWVKTIALQLLSSTATNVPGVLTPSIQLPDKLVIVGDNGCEPDSGGSFSTCSAGSGVFVADITNTPGGFGDGNYTGHVGLLRVLSLADTTGRAVHYRFDLEVCLPLVVLGTNFGD